MKFAKRNLRISSNQPNKPNRLLKGEAQQTTDFEAKLTTCVCFASKSVVCCVSPFIVSERALVGHNPTFGPNGLVENHFVRNEKEQFLGVCSAYGKESRATNSLK